MLVGQGLISNSDVRMFGFDIKFDQCSDLTRLS